MSKPDPAPQDYCPECQGTGIKVEWSKHGDVPLANPRLCENCRGSGWVPTTNTPRPPLW